MNRFRGKNGKRLLREALRQQRTLGCSEAVISQIARVAKVQIFPTDSRIIIQGTSDNRLAFVLSGRTEVLVKKQKVATRISGQHVGEMSVIDPSARRSATVVATETTTVAWVEERAFARIAAKNPELWRALAVEIADRLRQRGQLVRDPNSVPEVFIGSSSESIKVANAVQQALRPDHVKIKLWKQSVFGASETTIESLENAASRSDFAILVLTADDKITTRRRKQVAPRDNVVFELGLFMGALGRKRTIMLVEKKKSLRLPPDLKGVTYIPVVTRNKNTIRESVAVAVLEIRNRISECGVR
jgi:CRP/FNR family transcriptional regulator, cyclic AMP receptor protein